MVRVGGVVAGVCRRQTNASARSPAYTPITACAYGTITAFFAILDKTLFFSFEKERKK